jgi:bacillolysin
MRPYRRGLAVAVAVLPLLAVTAAGPAVPGGARGGEPAAEPFVAGAGAGVSGAGAGPGGVTRTVRDGGPLAPLPAIAELRAATATPPAIVVDPGGHLRSVSAPPGRSLRRAPGVPATSDPAAAAGAFVNRYGRAFGLRPGQQARRQRIDALPGGDRMVRFTQHIAGVPVLGGDLVVTVDRAGDVVDARAETPAGTPTAVRATVAAAAAGPRAVTAAAARLGLEPSALTPNEVSLWLYDPRLLGAPGPGELRPTWRVQVGLRGGPTRAATALVDATHGEVVLVVSELKTARDRLICDLRGVPVDLNNPVAYRCDTVAGGPAVGRTETGPVSAVGDVNQAYEFLGHTYSFYRNRFGRDSIDGRGMRLRATVRACHNVPGFCPYDNAFWDGAQMVFGAGYAGADDVVGHELTHGVTDHTSQLVYAFQSGAINEALSDIMGEFIDQTNGAGADTPATRWQIGEDLPGGLPIRDMADPSAPLSEFACDDPDVVFPPGCQPDRVGSPLYATVPMTLDNGGVHINSGIANKAAYLLGEPGTHSFNGHSVTGIGLAKSIQLWYRAMLGLTSGGDYEDLGAVLQSACRGLVGFAGFTVADCVEVDDAVAATEMISAHTAGTTEIALCPSPGQPVHDLFLDTMENGPAGWQRTGGAQVVPNANLPTRWAHSGISAMYVPLSSSITSDSTAAVPAVGQTYLWFAHNPLSGSHSVHFLDGGTTISVPPPWTFAGGPAGWTQASVATGYVSTRFDLTPTLAGHTIRLRFTTAGAGLPRKGEWLIDDVRVYQCLDQVGQVRNLAGPRNGERTTAALSWDPPQYTGPGVATYQISVFPALSGYPLTVPGGTTAHVLSGLDPNRIYSVSVRATDTNGATGEPATLPLTRIPTCSRVETPDRPPWICVPRPPKPTVLD